MTGPKEEWLIWDRRFQLGFSSLDQRLKKIEEAIQQFAQLGQQVSNLAASITRVQEDNGSLGNRIHQLERAPDRITQLDEQVQDLVASSRQLKEENNVLNDRISQLEREGTRRDLENERAQERLTETLHVQEGEFEALIRSMGDMHETAKAERGQRGEEMQRLRSQVEALTTAMRSGPRGRSRDASREMSEVTTTADDEMLVDQQPQPEQQQQQQSSAAHQDIEVHGVLIKAQASGTLFEDHLKYAETLFRRHEAEAVQAFVSSLQKKYRIPLGGKLKEHTDWTWQAVREESCRMLEAEKKTTRRSARLLAGSFQHS